ncbi:MAG: 30S ribosomal protein S13, partial [Candidatus Aenigmatarchaeota archaeon]
IKGVSFTLAKAVLKRSGVENVEIGALPESDVKKLEDVIRNPGNYGIPDYLLNRRKDPVTGENYHLVASDLHMKVREDINRLKKLGNYRGIRHRRGLPVRGQRTRSSFRKGKSVGVSKKRR